MVDNNKPIVPNFIPGVGNLTTGRFAFEEHIQGTKFRHNADIITLSPPITIQSVNYTDAQDAIAALALIVSPNPTPNATISSVGLIQLSGDIGGVGYGSATNIKVTGLQGRPVSILAPSTGQVITWSGTAWTPTNPPSALGAASGDLAGTYPAPTVGRINGATVPTAGSLTVGNVLQVIGSSTLSYEPINLSGGSNYVTGVLPTSNMSNLLGDVTGPIASNTVIRLQNNPILNTTPSSGQVLTWNGAAWTPANTVTSGSAGGDLTGTYPNPTIAKLQGNILSASSPTTGYSLAWSGSAWTPQPSAANLARGWATNPSAITNPDTNPYIVLSTIVTPTATGKFRISLSGRADNTTGSVTGELFLNFGHGTTPPYGTIDFAVVDFAFMNFGGNVGSITPVAATVDLDKLSPAVTFPLGTPVQFNIVMAVSVTTIKFDIATLFLSVQEVF